MNLQISNKPSGFILIYVATLLAVISILLFEVARIQSPSPLFMEKQIAHVLQWRESQLLLDFVIDGTHKQNYPIDPRLVQYKKIIANAPKQSSDLKNQIAFLRAALAQYNFKLDDRKDSSDQADLATTNEVIPHDGLGNLFVPRKLPYQFKLGETTYEVTILPGNSLPNLNSIKYRPLWRYLELLSIPPEESKALAAALIDWRDEDEFRTEGLGAESDYYLGLRPSYYAKNQPFKHWQELNYVRGMTPERLRLLRKNFMLGAPNQEGILLEFGSINLFVALTELPIDTVRAIYNAYTKPGGNYNADGSLFYSGDTSLFDKTLSTQSNNDVVRIKIASPENITTVDYDVKDKRILSRW